MRMKLLGLAALSLSLFACGDESSTSSQKQSLSDRQVLAMIAGGAGNVQMFQSIASSANMSGAAGRTQDQCADMMNIRDTVVDDSTGEKAVMTISATLPDGSPLTCAAVSAGAFKMAITMQSPSTTLSMSMTTSKDVDGSVSVTGTGAATFSGEGVSFGFSDMIFSMTMSAEGTLVSYAGSMKMNIDGATTDAISFDANGVVAQTVRVYRNGSVIGSIVFAADGSAQVRDASGALVEDV